MARDDRHELDVAYMAGTGASAHEAWGRAERIAGTFDWYRTPAHS